MSHMSNPSLQDLRDQFLTDLELLRVRLEQLSEENATLRTERDRLVESNTRLDQSVKLLQKDKECLQQQQQGNPSDEENSATKGSTMKKSVEIKKEQGGRIIKTTTCMAVSKNGVVEVGIFTEHLRSNDKDEDEGWTLADSSADQS